MSEQLQKLLGGSTKRYPRELAERFPRIVTRVVALWHNPEALRGYFNELLIADHSDRQGFPPEIASEIFALSRAYEEQLDNNHGAVGDDDPWALHAAKIKEELEERGIRVGPRSLFDAAERGHAKEVLFLLQAGVDPDVRDVREWTPLMVASFEGSEEAALTLIEFGADIHAEDRAGYGPLHWAALNGYDKVVRLLLDRGANPNASSHRGWTPLLQAAAKGHETTTALLLEEQGNPNLASEEGWTPLHKAVANGHAGVVLKLLQKGADLLAAHQDGSTPMTIAQRGRHPEVMAVIRKWASENRGRTGSPGG